MLARETGLCNHRSAPRGAICKAWDSIYVLLLCWQLTCLHGCGHVDALLCVCCGQAEV